MDTEMGALYASAMAAETPEQRDLVDVALTVDASQILTSVLAIDGDAAVGHLALRPYGDDALEVKKVFVSPEARGRGISKALMREAEVIARERGIRRLVLQTGDRQIEAIALYVRVGYEAIPVYGAYTVMSNALCFEKQL
jgi:GNAT superfamily N-acetyltransferase